MASWEEFSAASGLERRGDRSAGAGRGAGAGREGRGDRGASPEGRAAPMHVDAWSDGSSRGNPGPGGYGAVLRYVGPDGQTHQRELSAGYRRTTNNRMELMGAIAALEALRRPCAVTMTTDSQYVVNAFNKGWIPGWIRRGWKTASKQPVKNVDLWKRLLAAAEPHDVTWVWVKGHAGHPENELCDELATSAADGSALLEDSGFEG